MFVSIGFLFYFFNDCVIVFVIWILLIFVDRILLVYLVFLLVGKRLCIDEFFNVLVFCGIWIGVEVCDLILVSMVFVCV